MLSRLLAIRLLTAASLSLAFALAAPATAQVVKKGALSGTLLSGVANAGDGATASILTAPASGVTILLRVCSSKPVSGQNPLVGVRGSTLGLIATFGSDAQENEDGGRACVDLDPGLVLPPGEELLCGDVAGAGSAGCTAMALVSKK